MTKEEFYGAAYPRMRQAEQQILALAKQFADGEDPSDDVHSIVYCCSRLKSADSMRAKLKQRGLPMTAQAALTEVYDAVGVRIICAFAEDVYRVVAWLKTQPSLEIVREKDYYAYPKESGYRSYHLIVRIIEGAGAGLFTELQIRTIATDFWSTLEHQLNYKKTLRHEALIRSELKRCADEIASTDLSMQTIRELLREEE